MNSIPMLKNYIISCHVDKPLEQSVSESKYDLNIQAGAALTEIRTCELNDHDGFCDSISDRNSRYSELTAIWWISKHIDSEYIGIAHYRRRFKLDDFTIDELLNCKVDVITSAPVMLNDSVENGYRKFFYPKDLELVYEIVKKQSSDMYDFFVSCMQKNTLHPNNMNIMKADLFKQYSEWIFPILNEFYKKSYEKTDVYQHRDVGFIAESLTNAFIMKLLDEGKKIVEVPIIQLKSSSWNPEKICDYSNTDDIYKKCSMYFKQNRIGYCCDIIGEADKRGVLFDKRLRDLSNLLTLGIYEREQLQVTLYEYLPYEFRSSLDILIEVYNGLRKALFLYFTCPGTETAKLIHDYIHRVRFSDVLIIKQCSFSGIEEEKIDDILKIIHEG